MKINARYSSKISQGLKRNLFCFLEQAYFPAFVIFFLAPGFYINPDVLNIFWVLRKLCLTVMFFAACMFLFKSLFDEALRRAIIFCLVLHLALLFYGGLMSFQFGGYIYFDTFRYIEYLLVSLVVTVLLCGYISNENTIVHSNRLIGIIALFIIIGTIYLFVMGAMTFAPIPIFFFESYDAVLEYSAETTSMLMLSAIYFLHLARGRDAYVKAALFFLVFLFFTLAIFAGSRGEVFVGWIVIAGILLRHFSIKQTVVVNAILMSIIFASANINELTSLFIKIELLNLTTTNVADSLFVQRMESVVGGEHFGNRDVLLKQSISILFDKPQCALTGCGFNFFQLYYNYEFGMYPHNFIMEMFVTYGLFFGLLILALAFCGLVTSLTNKHSDKLLYFVCVFLLGVGAKSGTLISISEIPVLVYFAYLGVQNFNIIGRKLKMLNFLNKKFN